MQELFLSLTPEVQSLALLCIASVIGGLLFVLYHRGFNIKGKSINVSLRGDNNTKEPSERVSPHATCEHRFEAIDLVKTIQNNALERSRIERIAVKDQMVVAEQSIKKLLDNFSKIYLKLLSEKNHPDPVISNSFQSYRKVLELLECKLIPDVRFLVTENHFYSYTETEFVEYIEDKTDSLRGAITRNLNDIYLYRDDVTRAELYNANCENKEKVNKIFKDMFMSFKEISIATKEKLNALDESDENVYKMFKNTM